MRWRLVDKINAYEPWGWISGHKGISLEEYSLLRPFGRKGVFPESMVIESCVQLARWLVMRSSDFQQTCRLSGIHDFIVESWPGMGEVMVMDVAIEKREAEGLDVRCEVKVAERYVGRGRLTLSFHDLAEAYDPDLQDLYWQDLYGRS